MTSESFLPEDDQDFLRLKAVEYRLHSEMAGNDLRRAVEFLNFRFPGNLFCRNQDGALVPAGSGSVLVLVPKGYAKTQLDSWYVRPSLFLANGQAAMNANAEQSLFNLTWQFWSRHLATNEWREGQDGLETYLQYIRAGLKCP